MKDDSRHQPTQIQYLPPDSLEVHPEAHRIPEMAADEWRDFIESVKSRREITDPVFALPNGRVFDGRHRLRAAKECNLPLIPVIFYKISEDEALSRMSEAAVNRRNLTPGQRAAIVLEFEELVEQVRAEARERYEKGVKEGGRGNRKNSVENFPQSLKGKTKTRDILAEKSGISGRYMQNLINVKASHPDLFAKVKAGEITINKAYTESKKREKAAATALTTKRTTKRRRQKDVKFQLKREQAGMRKETAGVEMDGAQSPVSPENIVRRYIQNAYNAQSAELLSVYSAIDDVSDETFETCMRTAERFFKMYLYFIESTHPDPVVREVFSGLKEVFDKLESADGYKKLKQAYEREMA